MPQRLNPRQARSPKGQWSPLPQDLRKARMLHIRTTATDRAHLSILTEHYGWTAAQMVRWLIARHIRELYDKGAIG